MNINEKIQWKAIVESWADVKPCLGFYELFFDCSLIGRRAYPLREYLAAYWASVKTV